MKNDTLLIATAIILAAFLHAIILSKGFGFVQRVEVKMLPENSYFIRP